MTNPIASTAPINPQGTTQVSVNFRPGDYPIATQRHGPMHQLLAPAVDPFGVDPYRSRARQR